jgi:hypothetical protein
MGRNNEQNKKKHNDKLAKERSKAMKSELERKEKLTAIIKKYNNSK